MSKHTLPGYNRAASLKIGFVVTFGQALSSKPGVYLHVPHEHDTFLSSFLSSSKIYCTAAIKSSHTMLKQLFYESALLNLATCTVFASL